MFVVRGKKKQPSRFIVWLLEFLLPKKRGFLLAVFSKLPFSPELCQKMALLCADSPSPLQQVIKSEWKGCTLKVH